MLDARSHVLFSECRLVLFVLDACVQAGRGSSYRVDLYFGFAMLKGRRMILYAHRQCHYVQKFVLICLAIITFSLVPRIIS